MQNSPWAIRPLTRKLYGSRTFTIPAGTATTPGFLEIALPTWAVSFHVTGSLTDLFFGFGKRSDYLPDGAWSVVQAGLFRPLTSSGSPSPARMSWNDAPFRDVVFFRPAINTATVRFAAILSSVPYNAMPDSSLDVGAWATYNTTRNDPA